jgi:hypothetical protein
MSSTLTRGPLPARVYWTRRLLLLGTVFALVFAFAHLLGGGSDAASAPQARQAAARTKPASTTTPSTSTSVAPLPTLPAVPGTTKAAHHQKNVKPTPPPLAEPEGTCSDADIAVTPAVHHAFAGEPVTMVMKLRTIQSPACTWTVSPDSMTVKITSGADDIWFSRECTRSIPRHDVVVRNTQSTKVELTWSGRRSDDTCSRFAGWAMPGWYHVSAAAYAGEPSDVQFRLRRPTASPPATETTKPDSKSSQQDQQKQGSKTQDSTSGQGSTKPDKKQTQKRD